MNIIEFPTIEHERIFGTTKAKSIPTELKFIKKYLSELIF